MRLLVLSVAFAFAINTSLVGGDRLAELENEIIDIISKVSKSVVSVGAICPEFKGTYQSPSMVARRIGCGIVLDSLGYVITTGTIVDGADEIEVTTIDGVRQKAMMIGKDAISDIAVVKVSGLPSAPARFCDLTPKRGSMILVIGNAFGRMPSVMMGLVSGVQKDEQYGAGLLSIAAPINPGDIGAAVVNTKGEVVGLIQGRFVSAGYQADAPFITNEPSGLALAIATPKMVAIAKEIIENGSIESGFLGIRVVDADRGRGAVGMETTGALVIDVVKKSPADSIGLRRGDVITEFNSKSVDSASLLRKLVQKSPPGTLVTIRFKRGVNTFTRNVKIATRPDKIVLGDFQSRGELQSDLMRNRIRELEAEIKTLKQQLQETK
ncbi:MAG: S1C family serine protease [bacterium]